jgi:hypothetical protein
MGQWPRKSEHGFTAAIVFSKDVQKATLLKNGIFRPGCWSATFSERPNPLSFPTKSEKRRYWIFQI